MWRRPDRSWIGLLVVLGVLLVTPKPVEARYYPGDTDPEELAPFYAMALFLPNIYLEINGENGDLSADLGWPLLARVFDLEAGDFASVQGHLLAEARLDLAEGAWRGVFGGRWGLLPGAFDHFGVFGEGGYVIGEDGKGALVGGGLSYEIEAISGMLLLSYRNTLADTGPRHSVTLDFELPLPVFLLYQ